MPASSTTAAGVQIFLSESEAVVSVFKGFKTVQSLLVSTVGDCIAIGLVVTPDDPSAELVELSEPESFSVENGDDGCIRDIHSNFYDSGADENIDVAVAELIHNLLFFFWFHFAVEDIDGKVGKYVCYQVFVFPSTERSEDSSTSFTRGQRMYAWCPFLTSSRMWLYACCMLFEVKSFVLTGFLPLGISSIILDI